MLIVTIMKYRRIKDSGITLVKKVMTLNFKPTNKSFKSKQKTTVLTIAFKTRENEQLACQIKHT